MHVFCSEMDVHKERMNNIISVKAHNVFKTNEIQYFFEINQILNLFLGNKNRIEFWGIKIE